MSSFSSIELFLAKALDSFPVVKNRSKFLYQKIQYIWHKRKGFTYETLPSVSLCRSNVDSDTCFFGYYDKSPWNSNQSELLLHTVNDNNLGIVVVRRGSEKILLANTGAWSIQQGSMLQWRPSHTNQLLFNKILDDGRLGCVVVNTAAEIVCESPMPVQSMHPDGNRYLSLNYLRLHELRPEYGYNILCNNFTPNQELSNDGIWCCSFNGTNQLVITLDSLAKIYPKLSMEKSAHKVNHAMISKDGGRFVFMHRWLGSQGKFSRLYVSDFENFTPRLLLDDRMVSHYSWIDRRYLICYCRYQNKDGYYKIDSDGLEKPCLLLGLNKYGDGHPSVTNDGRWLIIDTYPDKSRIMHLILVDLQTMVQKEVASFYLPWKFYGANRCDLHPRWSPDGRMVSVDSCHEGFRMNYILNLERVMTEMCS